MIPAGAEIYMAVGPIDLRWGFHRLSGVVNEQIGRDVRCGELFLFIGKRRDALKIGQRQSRQRGIQLLPDAVSEGGRSQSQPGRRRSGWRSCPFRRRR